MDQIHESTEASAVEGGEVVPDRSSTQRRFFHTLDESGRREGFPLNVTNSSISSLPKSEFDPEVDSSDPCAE